MFDSANLSHKVDKAAFRREEPRLRDALLNAQYDLGQNGKFPVLILTAGVEGAGKGETVNLLNEWIDPRHIYTHAFSDPSDEERERPPMWRFWRALPPKGKVGVFFGAWHTIPIVARTRGLISAGEFSQRITEIQRFERMLSDEGVLLLKFWFHLTKEQQRKRLKALEKDPRTRWRVTDLDWKYFKLYDKFVKVCEPFLRKTFSRSLFREKASWNCSDCWEPRVTFKSRSEATTFAPRSATFNSLRSSLTGDSRNIAA